MKTSSCKRNLKEAAENEGIEVEVYDVVELVKINPAMKTATVEPGVTFGMLLEATKKYKLRPSFPDAPLTVSVLANYYLRGIYQTSAADRHDHTISYEMVLPKLVDNQSWLKGIFEARDKLVQGYIKESGGTVLVFPDEFKKTFEARTALLF